MVLSLLDYLNFKLSVILCFEPIYENTIEPNPPMISNYQKQNG